MLKELMDRLVELCEKGNAPQVLYPKNEPGHIWYAQNGDGMWKRFEAEPPPRNHIVGDLVSLVRFALNFETEDQEVEIWYSRMGVVCYLDGTSRRDRVTMPLMTAYPLDALMLVSQKFMEPKTFLRFLTIDLGGRVPEILLNGVRNDSFPYRIIPDSVVLYLPCIDEFTDLHGIECAIEVREGGNLALTILPGEVERAFRSAELDLGRALAGLLRQGRGIAEGEDYEEGVKLFCGVP